MESDEKDLKKQTDENTKKDVDELKSKVLGQSETSEKVEDVKEVKEEKKDEVKNQEEKPKKETSSKIESDKKTSKHAKINNKHKRTTKVIIIVSILCIIIAILSTGFALINANNDTICIGITANGINIEGLTKEQAIEKINSELSKQMMNDISLTIDGEIHTITQEQIQVSYDIEKTVEDAFAIGRNGNIFENNFSIIKTYFGGNNIEIPLLYNEELLIDVVKGINAKLPNAVTQPTYSIEDDELIVTKGKEGYALNVEETKNAVINAIKTNNYNSIEVETEIAIPEPIDMKKIYDEVYTEPKDAYYTTNPYKVYPHVDGINFNLEEAEKLLQEDKEEYVIDLEITSPEVKTNDIGTEAFPDLLSRFSTKYDASNIPRSTNLELAAGKLDGYIVMPGETFSYNKAVGKRTVEAGYKNANGFSGGKVVPMLGGGICQISSTLYDAVLYANLEIVERHNHMFQATYVDPGKDATVVYGSLDFKFKNTRSNPIMLKTSVANGTATIEVYGIKEEVEYEIEILSKVLSYVPYSVTYVNDSSLKSGVQKVSQYGLSGCKSITYRIKKLNGVEISREVLSTDTYSPLDQIVRKGTKGATTSTNKNETSTQKPEENKNTVDAGTKPVTPTTPEVPENNSQTPSTSTPETSNPDTSVQTPENNGQGSNLQTPEGNGQDGNVQTPENNGQTPEADNQTPEVNGEDANQNE